MPCRVVGMSTDVSTSSISLGFSVGDHTSTYAAPQNKRNLAMLQAVYTSPAAIAAGGRVSAAAVAACNCMRSGGLAAQGATMRALGALR